MIYSAIEEMSHSDAMEINFICSLPLLVLFGALLVYTIIQLINVIKKKTEITIIEKVVLSVSIIYFVLYFIFFLFFWNYLKR